MASSIDELTSKAVNYVVEKHSPSGSKIGWLMIASILVEAWDLYSISFILIFISQIYHPSALLLGLAAGGTQAGAVVGALLGGWLTDKIGRRHVFLGTMIMFIIFGIAQAFAPNVAVLVVIRFILGIPLGADIANGYTYIMEYVQKGKREVMGNRWQFMFAVGEIASIAAVLILMSMNMSHELLWRVILGLSGVPAIALFVLRYNLPETVVWLIQHGKFVEAKQTAQKIYGDSLDMLPNVDQDIPKPRLGDFLKEIRKDNIKWRATLFGWLSGLAQGAEFATFGFYIPVLFVLLKVSGIFQTDLVTLALYIVAMISGWVGPMITPKIGQRNLSIAGFSISLVSLVAAAIAIFTNHLILIPFAAAAFLWGHYWDAENCMTIASMVAPAKYRGTASGFAYIFVKIAGFLSLFLFPAIFTAIGKGNATLLVACFSLLGLLSAIFILPEVYGYSGQEG